MGINFALIVVEMTGIGTSAWRRSRFARCRKSRRREDKDVTVSMVCAFRVRNIYLVLWLLSWRVEISEVFEAAT